MSHTLDIVVRASVIVIHQWGGYVKTKDCHGERNPHSTANKVNDLLAQPQQIVLTPELEQIYQGVLGELAVLKDKRVCGDALSEFQIKVAQIVEKQAVHPYDIALLSAAVGTAMKELVKDASPKAAAPSRHFGTIGKRVYGVAIVVDRVRVYYDNYTHDEVGHIVAGRFAGTNDQFVWFTSTPVGYLMNVEGLGKEVLVDLTPKHHKDDKFGKSTVVNRLQQHIAKVAKPKRAPKAAAPVQPQAFPAIDPGNQAEADLANREVREYEERVAAQQMSDRVVPEFINVA